MQEISAQNFIEGTEKGYISEIFTVDRRVYGKDCRVAKGSGDSFKIVWFDVP